MQNRVAGQLVIAHDRPQGTVPLAKLVGENMFGLQPLVVLGSSLDLISTASCVGKNTRSKEELCFCKPPRSKGGLGRVRDLFQLSSVASPNTRVSTGSCGT